MTDEKFDLEEYLRRLDAAGLSEHDKGEISEQDDTADGERTPDAPEQDETETQSLFARLTRWVRRRAFARASAPAADETPNVAVSRTTPDSSSEAQRRTRAQAELPPAQPDNRPDTSDGGNSAVSAAPQPKRANALPSAETEHPTAPYTRDVAETSSGYGAPYGKAVRSTAQADDSLALPPPETSREEGTVAPSARALTPPERSSVPNTSGTEESFSAAQERTHAQPATSPPQPYAAPAAHPGDVAGRSSARRTNGATPDLHTLARTLERELRRYG